MTDTNETWEQRQAREQKEAEARRRVFFTLAAGIVKELGDEWELKAPNPDRDWETRNPHIRRKADGAEFYLSSGGYHEKDRVSVGASWPKDATGREQQPHFADYSPDFKERPGIGFALSKTPQQAARDIQRRFLSVYLPQYEKQRANVQGQNDHRANRLNLGTQIAALLGGRLNAPRDKYDDKLATVSVMNYDHGITAVEFDNNPDKIEVTIRCTYAELQQLAAMFPRKQDQE
jgi:hypothetical protein